MNISKITHILKGVGVSVGCGFVWLVFNFILYQSGRIPIGIIAIISLFLGFPIARVLENDSDRYHWLPWLSVPIVTVILLICEYIVIWGVALVELQKKGMELPFILPLGRMVTLFKIGVETNPTVIVFWVLAIIGAVISAFIGSLKSSGVTKPKQMKPVTTPVTYRVDTELFNKRSEDFKGMAEENRRAAYILMGEGINTKAITALRDATECKIKSILVHNGVFNPNQDMHHNLRVLAEKAGLGLKKETLEFLQNDPAFQHTKNANVDYQGTKTAIRRPGQVDERIAMVDKVIRCVEICEEVWSASASRLQ